MVRRSQRSGHDTGMRIIAGDLGGRIFDSPPGNRTHPMSERARGGLFNTLGDVTGLSVLDVFAGSGALSFEAVSRGAASATAIDVDKSAAAIITQNAEKLGVGGKVKAIRAGLSSWIATTSNPLYDLILADPPYDDLQVASLSKLADCLKPSGIFALSWPGKQEVPALSGLELLQANGYGDIQLAFYKPSR